MKRSGAYILATLLATGFVLGCTFLWPEWLPQSPAIGIPLSIGGLLVILWGAYHLRGPLRPLIAGLLLSAAADLIVSNPMMQTTKNPMLLGLASLALGVAAIALLSIALVSWIRHQFW